MAVISPRSASGSSDKCALITTKEIYLVGHIAPGCDERQGAPPRLSLAEPHNSRYISLVTKYANIVTGQFFGHLHSDTFRIVYGLDGEPVSNIFIAPSITPRRTSSGANNPGIRLYKIESSTGQVLDYTQYYLDLEKTTKSGEDNWTAEYNFTSYYGLSEVTPLELHYLVQLFPTDDGVHYFKRYWYANSVRTYDLPTKGSWKTAHFCAITQIDYSHYNQCVDKRTSALAASRAMQSGGSWLAGDPALLAATLAAGLLAGRRLLR